MDYVLTLNKINRSDSNIAGFKAVDLANLFSKKVNVPISFVIKSSLFEDFTEQNQIKPHINRILTEADYSTLESLEKSFEEIKDLFSKFEFSKRVQDELLEAYETLAIDLDHINIAKLVTSIEKPSLIIVGSPNYLDDSEDNTLVFQNIKGNNAFLNAIKNCWILMYSPKSLIYRKSNDLGADPKMALIVQRMIEADISVQTYSDEENITTNIFLGLQDFNDEIGKDTYIFSKDNLNIKNSKVNVQAFKYVISEQDGVIIKQNLKEDGESQKLNDKDVEELARITKRTEGFVEHPVKIFFSMKKDKIYLLFANRIMRPSEQKEEFIEETLRTESSVTTEMEDLSEAQKQKVSVMPEDKPEAKAETLPERDDIKLEDDIQFLEQIEDFENKTEISETSVSKTPDSWTDETEKPSDETTSSSEVDWTEESQTNEEEHATITTEDEKEISETSVSDDDQKPTVSDTPAVEEAVTEPDVTEKPTFESVKTSTQDEMENDDFILSGVEDDTSSEVSETKDVSPEPEPIETKAEVDNPLEEVNELLKKAVIISDDAVKKALMDKHEEMTNTTAETWKDAIHGLKASNVRVPFVEEIKKVNRIRQRLEEGQPVDVDEAASAIRNAKHFLSLF